MAESERVRDQKHELEKTFDFYINTISDDDNYWKHVLNLPTIEQQREIDKSIIKSECLKDDLKQLLQIIEQFENKAHRYRKDLDQTIQSVVNDYIIRNTTLPQQHTQYGCDDKDPVNFGSCERCTALILHRNMQMKTAIDLL